MVARLFKISLRLSTCVKIEGGPTLSPGQNSQIRRPMSESTH